MSYYICDQTVGEDPLSASHLRNRAKEAVLAQADVASGKADGSLLTIISSPIMLQERSTSSTYYTVSSWEKVATGYSFF